MPDHSKAVELFPVMGFHILILREMPHFTLLIMHIAQLTQQFPSVLSERNYREKENLSS